MLPAAGAGSGNASLPAAGAGRDKRQDHEASGEDGEAPEEGWVAIDAEHDGESGEASGGGELNGPVVVVGESDGVLDEGERKGKAGGGSGQQQAEAGEWRGCSWRAECVADGKPGDAGRGGEQEDESGVLLDEGRDGEEDSRGEGRERRKVKGFQAQEQPEAEEDEEGAVGVVKGMGKDAAGAEKDERQREQKGDEARGQQRVGAAGGAGFAR